MADTTAATTTAGKKMADTTAVTITTGKKMAGTTAVTTTAGRGRVSFSSGRGRASTSSGREAIGADLNVHKKSTGSTGDASNEGKTGQDGHRRSISSGLGGTPDDNGPTIGANETVKEGMDFYMVEDVQIHKDQSILQDQKSIKPLSIFSRRTVFAVKVWSFLFLYTVMVLSFHQYPI